MIYKILFSVFVIQLFCLLFPQQILAAITFQGGFENALYQYPNTINNWHDAKPGTSYSYWENRLSRVNSPLRTGSWALKIQVKPGDSYGSSGERAEVYWMYDDGGKHIVENEGSGTQYYAVSVYLPVDFVSPYNSLHPGTDSVWGVFQQLHGSDVYSAPPVFSIGAVDTYYVQMWSGDIVYYRDPTKAHIEKYSLGALNRGKWVDFVWKIKYAKTFTGTIDVWKRVEGEPEFKQVLSLTNIPTLQFKSTVQGGAILDAYWRTGYYTSQEIFTRIIYLDSHVRGDSFNEVVQFAFGDPIITVTPVPSVLVNLVGDANEDSVVNLLDFSVWKKEYLGQLNTKRADFDKNMTVDLVDYVVWRREYF